MTPSVSDEVLSSLSIKVECPFPNNSVLDQNNSNCSFSGKASIGYESPLLYFLRNGDQSPVPVPPQIMEAEIIHLVDSMDAKMMMMLTALQQTKEGEFSAKIFPLDGRSLFNPGAI